MDVQRRYLGLKFKIKGQTHYGWARLNVRAVLSPHPAITAVLTGYAYETVPDKSIIAEQTKVSDETSLSPAEAAHEPESPTLGLLAIGASGLSIWRREESVSPAQ